MIPATAMHRRIVSTMGQTTTRSANMRANRRRDTKPELAVRQLLHARGLRYRCDYRVRAADRWVRPDIVFTRHRIAVFIDGCFWHSCPDHSAVPSVNRDYWKPKLRRNQERDSENTDALAHAGWTVIRAWEHESPPVVADTVHSMVLAATASHDARREAPVRARPDRRVRQPAT